MKTHLASSRGPEVPSRKPSGLRIPLCLMTWEYPYVLWHKNTLMLWGRMTWLEYSRHITACPVFVLKYTFDNVLKSLHQKYSASLKGSCIRHSWGQPICNLMGICWRQGLWSHWALQDVTGPWEKNIAASEKGDAGLIVSTVHKENLRIREVTWLRQGHTTSKRQA